MARLRGRATHELYISYSTQQAALHLSEPELGQRGPGLEPPEPEPLGLGPVARVRELGEREPGSPVLALGLSAPERELRAQEQWEPVRALEPPVRELEQREPEQREPEQRELVLVLAYC